MKSVMKNKKAIEINITTIIVLVLAILVLVVIALYFTGGMTSLWSQIIGKKVAYTGSALDDAKNKCENLFTVQQFCETKVDVYNAANKTSDYMCCLSVGKDLVTYTKPVFKYEKSTGETIYIKTDDDCTKLNYNPCTD
jgi:hypothetical protein